MYIVYNKRDMVFRMYFDCVDYNWCDLIKYGKKYKWDNVENCFITNSLNSISISYLRNFCVDYAKYLIDNHHNNKTNSMKNYYKNNINKIKKRNKIYYKNNINKIKENSKLYREKHRNEISIQMKNYRKNNIIKILLKEIKRRATNKNIQFKLTENDVLKKIEETKNIRGECICPILGIKMLISVGIKKYFSISIDRINNNEGYTVKNTRIISHRANAIKGDKDIKFLFKLKKYITLGINNILPKQTNNYLGNKSYINTRYAALKYKATKVRNLNFDLEKSDIIFPKIDFFGFPISIEKNCPRNQQPSCDRIDPLRGYTKDNIYWISTKANTMKNNITLDICEKLIAYMKGKI